MKTKLAFLPIETRKKVEEVTEELGLTDPFVFVRRAVEDKLLDFKRSAFFSVSDKVRKGLLQKGVKPSQLLKSFKS